MNKDETARVLESAAHLLMSASTKIMANQVDGDAKANVTQARGLIGMAMELGVLANVG